MAVSESSGRLAGKIAFISGGASGIGAASAILFAKEGAKGIAITDLPGQQSKGDELVAKIESLGSKAMFIAHDVTLEEDWERAIAETEAAFGGPLDVLVNSAGIGNGYEALEDLEYSVWKKMISVNLDGTFLGVKHGIRSMKKNESQSTKSIINLSSIEGIVGEPHIAHYNASKGGVRLFTKSAALYCGQAKFPGGKIRVNSVHPGYIRTPMINGAVDAIPGYEQGLLAKHPIGRLGEAEDIANSIAFLASEDSSFMTGSEVVVDGGYTAQ
ncbi:NAD(P)-binding protein [Gonapodya prolifera JEL478]|uniref:NAD(P)-binding protein n=1 Tax=Gonapodya prolifera (strain JEL478) TaxID=1344416 RepID=A0A139AHY7_GONPJ|nr:NAD(P)-binding protein [Gonapodya prolifera JEL478]|eukprot:KXS16442.1 NAD(P)-binding protein [Gonapodya prolifera JEL478]